MPKGYWIAHVTPNDDAAFASDTYKSYVEGAGPCFKEHGGKFLARGGAFEQAEGLDVGSRHVAIEFPSLDAAKACYHSEAYAEAKKHRQSVSNAVIVLVEGLDD